MEILKEERRDPAEEQPQRPAVAEVHRSHRQNSPREAEPGYPGARNSRQSPGIQPLELGRGHLGMLARIVAEKPDPDRHPDKAGDAEHDKRAAPRQKHDKPSDQRR